MTILFFMAISLAAFAAQAYPVSHLAYPKQTDPAIDSYFSSPHTAFLDPAVPSLNKLVIFLPGSFGTPSMYTQFQKVAAETGFHALGITYPNGSTIVDVCGGSSSDPNCYEKARDEIVFGRDTSPLFTVTQANGIENRLAKVLAYLNTGFPSEGWGRYLSPSGHPEWSKITCAGHSQGAGHCAYLGKRKLLDRVLLFSWVDFTYPFYSVASWISAPGLTPASSHFGFGHVRDQLIIWKSQAAAWVALGMDVFGPEKYAAEAKNGSHMIKTDVQVAEGVSKHSAPVSDGATPYDTNGVPSFKGVWQYMLLQP